MYIYNDFLKLKTSELSDYSAKGFALCYVETNDHLDIRDEHDDCVAYGLRLFFTEADLSKQWGDDWNDAPYDCNAGWPYDDTSHKDKDGKWQHTKHNILVLNVSLECGHDLTLPEYYGYNTPFSVEMINLGACAWMFFGKECKPIYAGATPLDVFERIGKWMHPCPELPDDCNYE